MLSHVVGVLHLLGQQLFLSARLLGQGLALGFQLAQLSAGITEP